MLRYELKKVFGRAGGRIALAILAALLVGASILAVRSVPWVNEAGVEERGFAAIRRLRAAQREWAGPLDEAKLRAVIAENARIAATPEAQSEDWRVSNIAYGWRQGFEPIRELLNCAFAEGFRSFDACRADRLTPDDAPDFYPNRVRLLKDWLAEEGAELFSQPEKDFLIARYEALEAPMEYDYALGWTRLFRYLPTIQMIALLVLGYLVAGIFAGEFQQRADAVLFSSKLGRSRAVRAKVGAGIAIVTLVYWALVGLFTAIVLLCFGADGARCPVQASFEGWKCFYGITNLQKYGLIALGGYLGGLVILLAAMWVSAKARSTALAAMVPFALLFAPSLLLNLSSASVDKVVGLMPYALLDMDTTLSAFNYLYRLAGRVVPSAPLLFALYGALALALPPLLYRTYRRADLT